MRPNVLPVRILVVDDNHDAADSLADLLSLFGADVHVCYDASCALNWIGVFDFDAGVFDIHMPELDGVELARRTRQALTQKPVFLIALTGVSDEQARQRTAEAGFDLHITKGAGLDVLITALSKFAVWLQNHRT